MYVPGKFRNIPVYKPKEDFQTFSLCEKNKMKKETKAHSFYTQKINKINIGRVARVSK